MTERRTCGEDAPYVGRYRGHRGHWRPLECYFLPVQFWASEEEPPTRAWEDSLRKKSHVSSRSSFAIPNSAALLVGGVPTLWGSDPGSAGLSGLVSPCTCFSRGGQRHCSMKAISPVLCVPHVQEDTGRNTGTLSNPSRRTSPHLAAAGPKDGKSQRLLEGEGELPASPQLPPAVIAEALVWRRPRSVTGLIRSWS